jgi:hypothetical protein
MIDNKYKDESKSGWCKAGFVLEDDIIDISIPRSGGQTVCGGRFPCPGEAPSVRGVPPLHEIMASPGAPLKRSASELKALRLQIDNGEYLTDEVLEETATRYIDSELLEGD